MDGRRCLCVVLLAIPLMSYGAIPLQVLFLHSTLSAEFNSSVSLPAVSIAVNHVNNSEMLLRGYSMQITQLETKCNGSSAVQEISDSFQSAEWLAILGGGCTVDTQTALSLLQEDGISMYSTLTVCLQPYLHGRSSYVAPLPFSSLTNIPTSEHVSYSSACLSDALQQLPEHFCMLPSKEYLTAGIAGLITYFQWKRVLVINQEYSTFTFNTSTLLTMLESRNTSLFTREVNGSEIHDTTFLFPPNVYIYVLNLEPFYARTVLCQALRSNLSSPGYAWIIPGWYEDEWWQSFDSNCSLEELGDFIRSSVIVVSHYPDSLNDSAVTASGITTSEFREDYRRQSIYGQYAYDAVWSVAFALNSTLQQAQLNVTRQRKFRELLRAELSEVDFLGVSGPVSFEGTRRRLQRIRVLQYRKVNMQLILTDVAYMSKDGLKFEYLENESNATVWPDGVPPLRHVTNYPLLPLWIVCHVYAALLIIFAVVCIVFNVVFRNKKFIRLTSPNLNYMIVLGTVSLNLSVYMNIYPPVSTEVLAVFCIARPWLITLGWTLSFMTINIKMWRVYLIYHNSKRLRSLQSKKLMKYSKDWHLMIIVLIFIATDVIILVVAESVQASRFVPTLREDREFPNTITSDGVTIMYFVEVCYTNPPAAGLSWVVVAFGYKLLLQVITVFLAFKTRNVEVMGLNESKEVRALCVVTTVLTVIVAVLRGTFSDYQNIVGASYALGISTSTAVILTFIFIPKMWHLCWDPQGDRVFQSHYFHPKHPRSDVHNVDAVNEGYRTNSLTAIKTLSFSETRDTSIRSAETSIETSGRLLESCNLQHTEFPSIQVPPVQKEMDTCSVQVNESNSE